MARKSTPTEEASDLSTVTFFGTLRSELDAPPALAGVLEEMHGRFLTARSEFLAGSTTEVEYGTFMKNLVYTDEVGCLWTIGASSGHWWRKRPSERWLLTPADLAVISAGATTTPA
jgi:hypothetical protein